MAMKNPPHPGLFGRRDCIEPLRLTITEAAEILGVTRQPLNNLVIGKSGISADMAIRLDRGREQPKCLCEAHSRLRWRARNPLQLLETKRFR